jgi:hypothetical protein
MDTATETLEQDATPPAEQQTQDEGSQQEQPAGDNQTSSEQSAADSEGDSADTESDGTNSDAEPAEDAVRRIERENAELKGQLDVLKQFVAQQSQAQQRPKETQDHTLQYKRALREYAERYQPDSPQAQSVKTLERILDAFMADLEPRLARSEQTIENSQRQLMRAAAKAEESDAIAALKQEFDASDAEIKAAREYAQKEYQRAAQSGEWPGSYQQLFERSIFRQRHAARKQGAAKDKAGEQRRLAAQVRADPTTGTRPSNATGRINFPDEALRDTQSLERFLRKQGFLVDD